MAHAPVIDLATLEDSVLRELLTTHRSAIADFDARARRLDAMAWTRPRAAGKWTPAQEARHLVLTYQAFTRNLRGEHSIRLKGSPLRRRIWRLIGLTWIIYLKRIPMAVRAPRAVQPEAEAGSQDALLGELAQEVETFETEFRGCWTDRPTTTVTHPFFGELDLRQAIRVAAVHTRHHAKFLPDSRSE